MMTAIIDRLTALGEDVEFSISGNTIYATLQDFAGFDYYWCAIERKFNNEEAVNAFVKWCMTTTDQEPDDMMNDYHFGEITLWLGYASADI